MHAMDRHCATHLQIKPLCTAERRPRPPHLHLLMSTSAVRCSPSISAPALFQAPKFAALFALRPSRQQLIAEMAAIGYVTFVNLLLKFCVLCPCSRSHDGILTLPDVGLNLGANICKMRPSTQSWADHQIEPKMNSLSDSNGVHGFVTAALCTYS